MDAGGRVHQSNLGFIKYSMRNFIIFFEEKEGTTPLVHLLKNFSQVDIVQQENIIEPFDSHCCGQMPISRIKRSLDIIYGKENPDFTTLNMLYSKTAQGNLREFSRQNSVGFKMRFTPPAIKDKLFMRHSFKRMMFDLLERKRVVVFLAVRQDILRWALSKYHGDGTGKKGHLQFKLAKGLITREQIGKIHVDCSRLAKILKKCERSHARKRRMMQELKERGVPTFPLLYEDFLIDKPSYFTRLFAHLGVDVSRSDIDMALQDGTKMKKVHSSNISDFVLNHEEVLEKFGDRYISWSQDAL